MKVELPEEASGSTRIFGLDSIRFVCAVIVVFGHFGVFPDNAFGDSPSLAVKYLRSITSLLFNGPAAVIVFFVLSGFCINLPQTLRRAHTLDVWQFYARRFIRILIPAALATCLYLVFSVDTSYPNYSVLWSVICEAVYYLLYPALLFVSSRIGWSLLVVFTTLVVFIVALANGAPLLASGNAYTALGLWTWLVGLPCWTLGCWLAENRSRFPLVGWRSIWLMRGSLFALTVILRIVKFHAHGVLASNIVTLNILAFVVVVWIGLEVRYLRAQPPPRWLEWAGKWSYSLYLIHPLAVSIAIASVNTSLWLHWVTVILGFMLALVFYYLVERPSHFLAQSFGRGKQYGVPAQLALRQ
ncbi:acyltransferase [Mesorhizobium sp. M1163]|uniref:acyltransferase family protein n=1 Tax=Mesorhizobium sp. M1163 TaxID=2957065 RepID=UPI00333DC02F